MEEAVQRDRPMKVEQFSLRQPGGGVEYAAQGVLRYMKARGWQPIFARWWDAEEFIGSGYYQTKKMFGHFHCVGVKRG